MSIRLGLLGVAAAAVTLLAGCVVVPAHPHHRYGYYEGPPVYAKPAPPVYRHGYGHGYRWPRYYRGW